VALGVESPIGALEAEVDSLRCAGKYDDATEAVHALLTYLGSNIATKPYQVEDAERLLLTLEFAAALPESARADLAVADQLTEKLEEAYGRGDLSSAEQQARRQLKIRVKFLGHEHSEVASSLNDLAVILWASGDLAGAEPLYRESLAMRRKLLGNNHPSVAESLLGLGSLLEARGDLEGAEPLYRESLAMSRNLLGADHPQVATVLNNLGGLLKDRGEYAEAEPFYRESLAIFRNFLGDEHPHVATILGNIAALLVARGDYTGAEPLFRESLEMQRKLLGDEHPAISFSLNNLASLLMARGDFASAEPLYRESLAIKRKQVGDGHPAVAISLGNLATLLKARGDYAGAEPLYRESLAILRKLLGNEHQDVATGLSNLAGILKDRGDYEGAELLYREALSMYSKVLGDENPNVANSLGNLGSLLEAREDYGGAEPLYREALAMNRKLFGNEHPEVAIVLNNLAGLLKARGDYEGAEPLYREALAMNLKLLGDEHPDVATVLNNLATLLMTRGDYGDAETLFRESLEMRRRLLGNEHPDLVSSLNNLSTLLVVRGDYAGAELLLTQATEVFDAARLRVGAGMERAVFNENSPYPALAVVRLNLGKDDSAWQAVERSQGRVLAELLMAAGGRGLSQDEAEQEKFLRLTLGDRERELKAFRDASSTSNAPKVTKDFDDARTRLLEAEIEWSAFQREIGTRHPVREGKAYEFARVQKSLTPHQAIIGWLDLPRGKRENSDWGYVIRNKGPVKWENLTMSATGEVFSTRGTDSSVASAYRKALTNSKKTLIGNTGYLADGLLLYRERIGPLMPHLGDVRELIVLSSGVMLGIPVESLPMEDGDLLAERFTISYSPSATIHTWQSEEALTRKATPREKFLLVGDPPFSEAHLASMKREDEGGLNHILLASAEEFPDPDQIRRGLSGNTGVLASLPRLPGTREEINRVGSLAIESRVLLGLDASEQVLVSMAKSRELRSFGTIHIATHGFMDDERPERSALVLSQINLTDPLENAMAGTRIYDGLLTAGEILQEWELSADLVTLSACETGLGKEISGEGLVGFVHAFLQAGSASLLVSLWEVPDQATSLLMQRFYENWLGSYSDKRNGQVGDAMSKAEALGEAKNWLREYRTEIGGQPYIHPYFWSGFILIGARN